VTTPIPVWKFARESSNVFAGPLPLTVTADGSPVDDADVRFAVIPTKQRPGSDDWTTPASNPDSGEGGIGVILGPAGPGLYGWWVQITVGGAVEVLEPTAVAWIRRT
jgi:hypothetical protein